MAMRALCLAAFLIIPLVSIDDVYALTVKASIDNASLKDLEKLAKGKKGAVIIRVVVKNSTAKSQHLVSHSCGKFLSWDTDSDSLMIRGRSCRAGNLPTKRTLLPGQSEKHDIEIVPTSEMKKGRIAFRIGFHRDSTNRSADPIWSNRLSIMTTAGLLSQRGLHSSYGQTRLKVRKPARVKDLKPSEKALLKKHGVKLLEE